ncbi:2-succinylbenzoate--CoA ligase [Leptolyngbya sp. FACHB-17]|uniref:2-succinylbenzoate--CoA ligase n=1 Tax=unclassified Leptolyngbya TaxID=2650499 RepID=UPI0016808A61|nr:2-succinylbenzoate--CoA ligase [Leptolyngbya sp. FACHB-17]MBD2079775.1 2-succinylbenzoate--CoA ligase [Leptolyngbya sp. FACHB-17]
MEQPLSRLESFRFADVERLVELARLRYWELLEIEKPVILLCDRDPVQFLAGFVAACSVPCQVFLCNPDWGETEWQQVLELVKPSLFWGTSEVAETLESPLNPPLVGDFDFSRQKLAMKTLIMIPTGGTSGKIRFAMHTWDTLSASVQGFRQYFEIESINSLCVLPLYHVSGLMQFMRSFLTGGTFITQSWKTLETQFDPQDFFISLVPTQLQQLMPYWDWLARFKTILLGGAPAWSDLLQQARSQNFPIAPTYGMTETASQIATLKPADFLSGIQGCGRVLPHAEITIVDQKLSIQAKSLMLGYYPNLLTEPKFAPDDLGYFDDCGFLHLLGRDGNKIISGGENIFPIEVEAAVRSTNLVQDIYVLGTPDPIWGQSVTAIFVPSDEAITIDQLKAALRSRLTAFKQPKHWIKVAQIPRTAQGKIQSDRIDAILK